MFLSKVFIQRQRQYGTLQEHVPAPYFRKSFSLDEIPSQAEITICGLGFYELYVNGNHITKGLLAPYISNPDQILYYDTYQIEKYLQKGKNTLGILLGNGFLNNPGGSVWEFEQATFRDAPKVAIAVELNGRLAFEADETFKTHCSPIIFDDLRAGEHYDARLEIEGWNLPEFDDSDWSAAVVALTPKGEARLCDCENIRFIEEREPVSIAKSKNGWLYTFCWNDAGLPLLKIRGKRGQEVQMWCGEIVIDGTLCMDNISFGERSTEGYVQRDVYICKGEGEECYCPRFTYHGFQYVYVEGITEEQATKQLITYKVLHSDIQRAGKFVCDNEIINRLQENTCRSIISNFHYFQTDCPHREKNGWTGDAAISAEHTMLNYHATRSWKEWLNSIRNAQTQEGNLPGIVPTYEFGYGWGSGPAWDAIIVQLPYYAYKYDGDRQILSDNLPAIEKYLDYAMTRADENGLFQYGLGDWCQPNRRASAFDAKIIVTDTLIILDFCYKARKIASILGEASLVNKFDTYYKNCRNSFIKAFVLDGVIREEYATQATVAMALYYHIFEGAEEKPFKQLLKLIEQADNHFAVGVLGARVMFRLLSDFGETELAYKLITQDSFPSYTYQLRYGATTLWEDFQILYDDKIARVDGRTMNSINHHFWGDISAWFYKYVAGIRINRGLENVNTVEIAPCFLKEVNYCYAERDYLDGKITVEWKRENGKITVNATAPKGVKIIRKFEV